MTATSFPPSAPIINGKKTFIPLENNPTTISALAQAYGASSLSFHDILSFTDADLLALVPRPVLSVIFLAPPKTYQEVRKNATPTIPDQRAVESASPSHKASSQETSSAQPVIWIPQTIGHACGTMALVHAVANGPARQHIRAESILGSLLEQMRAANPDDRARILYDSAELETAHMRVASGGDTAPPDPHEPSPHHFIAFVKDDTGYLWELEGGVQGPIQRGWLSENEDCLSDKAIELGVGQFIRAGLATGEIDFSCVAVVANIA